MPSPSSRINTRRLQTVNAQGRGGPPCGDGLEGGQAGQESFWWCHRRGRGGARATPPERVRSLPGPGPRPRGPHRSHILPVSHGPRSRRRQERIGWREETRRVRWAKKSGELEAREEGTEGEGTCGRKLIGRRADDTGNIDRFMLRSRFELRWKCRTLLKFVDWRTGVCTSLFPIACP